MTSDDLVGRGKQLAQSGKYRPADPVGTAGAEGIIDAPRNTPFPPGEEVNGIDPYADVPPPDSPPPDDSGSKSETRFGFDDLDGAQVLDDTKEFLARFVAYPTDWALTAHTLWIAHTHLMSCWESTPRIAFLSPEPASGKTRALEVSEPLVPRPVHAINTTPAYLFRKVSDPDGLPTILYDEIDTVFGPRAKEHEDVRGMLNAGHRNGAVAGRCVVRGRNIDTEDLPAYCAVAMAGLDDLPDTIMSRSVVIRMQRRAPTEPVHPWRHRLNTPEGEKLRDRLATWAAIVDHDAKQLWPELPDGIEDRNADVWEPLLAVADLAGGHWPDTARVAAVAAVAASKGDRQSLGVLLLHDIRNVFRKHDTARLCTLSVLTELRGIEESPWDATNRDGSALNAMGLAQRLRKYGIKSENMRDDAGKVVKGYPRVKFVDAWLRYLPDDDDGGGKDHTPDEGADRDSGNYGQQALSLSPNKPATAATPATADDEPF
jgi:Protein of unknown function (DUF3631)